MTTLVINNEESKLTPYIIKQDVERLDTINKGLFTAKEQEFGNDLLAVYVQFFTEAMCIKTIERNLLLLK